MVVGKLNVYMLNDEIRLTTITLHKTNYKRSKNWMWNPTWISVKVKTLKLLEEKIGSNLHGISVGMDFLNRTPFAQELKLIIDRHNLMKIKSFCAATETISGVKRKPTEWKRIFVSHTCGTGLIPEYKNNL